jgi:hypothetical protein
MTFEDMVKLFYFITFIPKFHILATRGEKSCILTIFSPILAILEDFLTEKEKDKLSLANDWLKVGLRVNKFGQDMKVDKEEEG